ncbi:hypothetical protein CO033_02560 [Candidatus Nomurabacteria bacterium CG_4_9_14_0_2_um_filter_32_10]|uniref:DUF4430 domain-containing protein n=3 Tax=Candidatus Nomuraibacteriota TaxID=1752729 RepID=A0A2H0CGX2_9BACT|nr:MAG: hypothetical protein COW91_00810 [Candidatus Nomurabacteria bacterium CG22_combo_CG10-13_8_21_14_all_32_8]PIZ85468.1 MAG: hypothetical protein COX94_02620 [Candidatus Nomurabacteria bacterium CG_4_10_14_0_2_um_filter_33_9]PJC49255.1 MAG: hypothetical protein CO033_02560 [Candidatus Nomurabacteria bacterium CG_4_9_14_0_2_um_filter_32_10]
MKNKIIITSLISFTIFYFFNTAYANTTINLNIETDAGSIYNQSIDVVPCDSEGDGVMKATPYCALVQTNIPNDYSGLWVNSINNILNNDNNNGAYWMWLVNFNIDPTGPYSLSSKQYTLENNDSILFYYNTNPLDISVDNFNPTVGDNITITITELGLDPSWNPIWNPAIGGKVIIGANTYDLDVNGTYSLLISDTTQLETKGQKDGFIDTSSITIIPSPAPTPEPVRHSSGGSYISTQPIVSKTVFDTRKALNFLISQQKENGSFGEELYTDWSTIALMSTDTYQNNKIKLIKYYSSNQPIGDSLTDYERRAIALMSLGLNPYNTNGENYIKKIADSYDGQQFGDLEKDNDDIFALIVLQNAGYTENEKIITDSINHILTKQKENGSWDESIDMTGAAIQAIAIFTEENFLLRGVSQVDEPRGSAPLASGDSDLGKERFFSVKIQDALLKAKEFLKQNQKEDGGFGNVSSTSWAISGIFALSEKPEEWKKNKKNPLDYLAENQDTDGGMKNPPGLDEAGEYLQNKIWETAYTLTALSGKTWNQIMQKFEKKEEIITKTEKEELEKKIEKILALLENKNKTTKIIKVDIPTEIKIEDKNIIDPKINTANVINSLENNNDRNKNNWFKNILQKIFTIF